MFARGFVNVLVAGSARLGVNTIEGLILWVGGKRVNELAAPIKLDHGRRTFTFAFNPGQWQGGLRVELKALDDIVKVQRRVAAPEWKRDEG